MRATKAELTKRMVDLETALAEVLASHRDFIECAEKNLGPPSIDWSQRIHSKAEAVLYARA